MFRTALRVGSPAVLGFAAALALAACTEQPGAAPAVRPVGAGVTQEEAGATQASARRALQEAEAARQAATRAIATATAARAAAERAPAPPAAAGPPTTRYAGETADGRPNGLGVQSYADEGRYEGQFVRGAREGVGIYAFPNGSRYEGEWRNGRRAGRGVLRTQAGAVSEGEWQDSALNGYGVHAFADGRRYVGEFRGGKQDGFGSLFTAAGAVQQAGRWQDGTLRDGAARTATAAPPAGTTAAPAPAAPPRESRGTGFFVSPDGHVLTNDHVIRTCATFEIRPAEGDYIAATLVQRAADDDLALLKAAVAAPAHARFRSGQALREGEEVVSYGFPLTELLAAGGTVSTGHVSALAGLSNNRKFLQISVPVQQGNSGGPLLDMDGNVVGVVTSKLNVLALARITGDIAQNVNFAVQPAVALEFLRGAGIAPAERPSRQRLSVADVAEAAKRYTVFLRCRT